MMPEAYCLNSTQSAAVDYCLEHESVLLIADKGSGKTRTGLAVAAESEGRTLVLCPNKVRSQWVAEGQRIGVPVALVDGDAMTRMQLLANEDEQILVMGVDLLPWLVDTFKVPPVDGLILDETTRFSSPGSVGVKKLRHWRKKLEWTLGLTASPVMEKPEALYGQALVLDGGKALGRSFETFRRNYFNQMDYMGYEWALQHDGLERLSAAVRDLVYYMSDDDYADSLPPLIDEIVEVSPGKDFWVAYEEMAETMAIEMAGSREVEAVNAAVLSGKLEQLCQGSVYDDAGQPVWIHGAKMLALGKILDPRVPTIVTYSYVFELEQLRQYFPQGRDLKDSGALEDFQYRDLNLLFVHPKSGSHGIELQYRCHEMICLKPIWSSDGWDQVAGRIRRRGQTHTCRRRTLVVPDTIDELIISRVRAKVFDAGALLSHIKTVAQK